jgi:hypothetical protein
LEEGGFTCLGQPSACFPFASDNFTLIKISVNTNNVFVELQTPRPIGFKDSGLANGFIKVDFLSGSKGATPYCQQQGSPDSFLCLLVYPSGTPNSREFVRFSYSSAEGPGSLIVEVAALNWPSTSLLRRSSLIT